VTAADFLPPEHTLPDLEQAAASCKGCPLWEPATQTVFGEGPQQARMILVGEQPGDQEDTAGHPFVGPAGRLLDTALEEAGIDRSLAYITNAVKHFKFEMRGKRRIHKKPSRTEVNACRPWLQAEIDALAPDVLVPLGATAGQAILGPSFRVTKQRGEVLDTDLGPLAVATIHPSAVLRADDDDRQPMMEGLIADLRVAAHVLAG